MAEGSVARSAFPIVVGLRASDGGGSSTTDDLALFVEREIHRCRQRCPDSPILLLADGPTELLAVAARAADASGIETFAWQRLGERAEDVGGAICEVGAWSTGGESVSKKDPHADFDRNCHVLILVARPDSGSDAKGRCSVSRLVAGQWYDERNGENDVGVRAMLDTNRYNRDANHAVRLGDGKAGLESGRLLPPGAGELPPLPRRLAESFAVADSLALAYQARVRWAFRVIFLLAAIAAALYGFFLTVAGANPVLRHGLLAPYLLLLLASYSVYYLAKNKAVHERFVEYRVLAEGLRVQFYWSVCGLRASAADSCDRAFRGELKWIPIAIASGSLRVEAKRLPETVDAKATSVLRHWIDIETRYFDATLSRARHDARIARFLVRAIFVLGVCATLLVLFQTELTQVAPYLRWIAFLSFLCPLLSAAIVALVNKTGMLYQIKHNARMAEIYARAAQKLGAVSTVKAYSIARALGEEALIESAEWARFRMERMIDEPLSPFRRPW
jgi:hypothetical protein